MTAQNSKCKSKIIGYKMPKGCDADIQITYEILLYVAADTAWHSSVTTLSVGMSRNHSSIPARGDRFFSSPKRPDQPWALPNNLVKQYHGLFP